MLEYRSPWETEDTDAFRTTVRRFFETEVAPYEKRWAEQQHVDKEVWRKAGDLGLLCTSIDEAYGGVGASFAHELVIAEEQARASDTAFGVILGSTMAIPILLHAATEDQKKQWIPKLATGEGILGFALTEPGAGSDAKQVQTRAVRDGDDYVINGSKTFISNGYNANLCMVVARTLSESGADEGLSMFMVERETTPGYRVGSILSKVGQRGQDTAELFFDDMRVPSANLLGRIPGQAFAQLKRGFLTERTIIGLMSVANAERAVELTVEYTKQRRVFGEALFDLQNTRFKLAECHAQARVARVFIDDCVVRLMNGTMDTPTASMAKLFCTEMQNRVMDECLQLHGGYGYITEFPIARMWADARVQRIYGGASEIQKEIIARSL
jgi:acyl-CoA dehydrogenase